MKMTDFRLERHILLLTFLSFFSCNNEIKKEISNIITPVSTPTVSSSISSKKDIEIDKRDVAIENFCKDIDLKDSELRMYNPSDIVSAKDGSYIYVISNYEKIPIPLVEMYNSDNSINAEYSHTNINKPIKILYKITKDKKISIIKNFDYLGCDLNQIEKKKNSELLILLKDKIYSFNNKSYNIELANINKKLDIFKIDFSKVGPFIENPKSFFFEDSKIYYDYFNNLQDSSIKIEFIEEFNFYNKEFNYTYSNEEIQNLKINSKFKNYYNSLNNQYTQYSIYEDYYSSDPNSYSHFSMYKNNYQLYDNNKAKNIPDYTRLYSIYEGKPIFDITDLIKDKEEIKKVGKVMIIRKNSKGEVFGLDAIKNIVWKILPKEQKITLFAGSGKTGYKDGKGELAEFNGLVELDIDDLDNLYIADYNNNAIRKITPDGEVSTFYKENK